MTQDEDEVPALFQHCTAIYSAMQETAERHESGNLYIWEGFLTKLFEQVGYGVPGYTRITRTLSRMGCIEQIERGGGTKPSRWYLHKAPTIEDFDFSKRKTNRKEGRETKKSILDQRISDLISTMNDNRSRIDTLEELVRDLQSQLQGDSNG